MTEKIKALTIWQPYASLIAAGLKQYETRSWSTRYRGLLAIHAAKRWIGEECGFTDTLTERYRYMIDQSHNIEPKLEAMLLSVINCQRAYAKALIVDYKKLNEMQLAGDVLGGHLTLMEAFETDVDPLLAQARGEIDRPANPLAAYRADDYAKKVAEERGSGGKGWT